MTKEEILALSAHELNQLCVEHVLQWQKIGSLTLGGGRVSIEQGWLEEVSRTVDDLPQLVAHPAEALPNIREATWTMKVIIKMAKRGYEMRVVNNAISFGRAPAILLEETSNDMTDAICRAALLAVEGDS